MEYKKSFMILLILLFSINSYGQEFYGKKKEIKKILQNIESFSQYYMNGEIDKLVACYTADGKIMPNRLGILEGEKDLKKYWNLPDGVKILHHKVTPSEIKIAKKTAYDYGFYEGQTLTPNGEKVSWKGKYIIVWKKIGKEKWDGSQRVLFIYICWRSTLVSKDI